jgi:hypothetical protein
VRVASRHLHLVHASPPQVAVLTPSNSTRQHHRTHHTRSADLIGPKLGQTSRPGCSEAFRVTTWG